MSLPDKAANTSYTLPHSIEAEQALLGELLLNNDSLDEISDILKPEHFALPFHQSLYELILKKVRLNQLASPLTLKEFFSKEEKVGEIEAYEYVMQLTVNAVTISNAVGFAQMVYDMYMRRQLIIIGQDISKTAFEATLEISPVEQIESAEQLLFSLAEKGHVKAGLKLLSLH